MFRWDGKEDLSNEIIKEDFYVEELPERDFSKAPKEVEGDFIIPINKFSYDDVTDTDLSNLKTKVKGNFRTCVFEKIDLRDVEIDGDLVIKDFHKDDLEEELKAFAERMYNECEDDEDECRERFYEYGTNEVELPCEYYDLFLEEMEAVCLGEFIPPKRVQNIIFENVLSICDLDLPKSFKKLKIINSDMEFYGLPSIKNLKIAMYLVKEGIYPKICSTNKAGRKSKSQLDFYLRLVKKMFENSNNFYKIDYVKLSDLYKTISKEKYDLKDMKKIFSFFRKIENEFTLKQLSEKIFSGKKDGEYKELNYEEIINEFIDDVISHSLIKDLNKNELKRVSKIFFNNDYIEVIKKI